MSLAERIVVPRSRADATEAALRDAGRDGYERFVLWSGVVEEGAFHVRTVHVPEQIAFRGKSGVCVTVEGPALHALNVWLYEHREVLGVQVHTHPDEAYHSHTDDSYPIVTAIGGYSLVLPHFCEAGLGAQGSALYRLGSNGWDDLDTSVLELE